MIEDVGGLGHLDHEGGLAPREHVGGADPGENPISEPDGRFSGGHERACVGHQRDQRGLTEVGRFSSHVGTGEDHDLAGLLRFIADVGVSYED